MKVGILQVSDCHFQATGNILTARRDALIAAACGELESADRVLIAVTGDIAFSGRPTEYEQARSVLEPLVDALGTQRPDRDIDVAVVAGNHDCDFTLANAARTALIGNANSVSSWDDSISDVCLKVQSAFDVFAETLGNVLRPADNLRLVTRSNIELGSKRIAIWGVNSAWMSRLDEQPGRLVFPVHRLRDMIEASDPAVNVLLLHHPMGWWDPDTRRELIQLIDTSFDLVLAGHEHRPESWERHAPEKPATLYLEGGVLQEHGAHSVGSTFNVVVIDFEKQRTETRTLEFVTDYYQRATTADRAFGRAGLLVARHRCLRDEFSEYLDSAGANFRHPRKAALSLHDIYVVPDLMNLADSRALERIDRPESSDDVLERLATSGHAVIAGGDKSGKSALLRHAFRKLHAAGLTPVRLDGSSIRSTDREKLIALVEGEYTRQYASDKADYWRQLPAGRRCILLDDLGAARLNHQGRLTVLNSIRDYCGSALVTCDEALVYRTAIAEPIFPGYETYELLELGHRRRDQLITRWIRLGQTTTLDEATFEVIREERTAAINALIGKNFIPSRPMFLLTLLQSMEAAADGPVQGSSYGQYYEYLIRHALSSGGVRPEDLDAVLNYLTELAYIFVDRDAGDMSVGELHEFNANFSRRYALQYDWAKLKERLANVDILEERSSRLRFKYKYVKLFFAARYLARHYGTDPAAREIVRALSQHLYLTKCADLMLFVVHHSDDPTVVDLILDEAAKIFRTAVGTDLGPDVDGINQLVAEAPRLALRDGSPDEHRVRRLEAKDEAARVEKERDDDGAPFTLSRLRATTDAPELEFAAEINHAIRVVGLLGQIMRNYYGSLLGDRKSQIGERAYDLLSRTLGAFLGVFAGDREALVADLAIWLQEQNLASKDDAREKAAQALFALLSMVSFGVIKRGSELLGSDKVKLTHEAIASRSPSIFKQLLWLATDLDHPPPTGGSTLPMSRLRDLKEALRANPLGTFVLRRLVIDHLYMFSVSYKDKQRICELLGIPVRRQNQITSASKRKRN